jgi:phospholipid/cholesterol/gamma-HCH transport system permease protein
MTRMNDDPLPTPTDQAPPPIWLDMQPGAPGRGGVLHLLGAWRLAQLPPIEQALAGLPAGTQPAQIDASGLQQLDSAAALVLLRHLGTAGDVPAGDWVGLRPQQARILQAVRGLLAQPHPAEDAAPALQGMAAVARTAGLPALGRASVELGQLLQGHLTFLGGTFMALAAVLRRPRLLRLRECTVMLEQSALGALPVVCLVTLLIGVVVAYLLGLQAEQYGANIFVVDGVGVGATREFAPLLVAVVVAGRSGAAFAAQLGSMRLTEETDAIRTLGLDLWQVLVLPRVLALVVAMPLLVFVGDVMSLLGAMFVCSAMLDIPPAAFLARLQQTLELRHVLIGLAKAPVFALVIAVIATRMGLTVGRDTRAVGAATTSTVVQGIVAVILLDAAFAVLFQALGL